MKTWLFILVTILVIFLIGGWMVYMESCAHVNDPFARRVTRYPCTEEERLEVLVKSGNRFPGYEKACLDNITTY